MNKALNEFEGYWYDPGFDSETVEGTLSFNRWSLFFHSEITSEEIPLERIEVVLSEDGERVDFRDSERPELVIYTLDDSVLQCRMLPQAEAVLTRRKKTLYRREMNRRYRILAYAAAGCFGLYLLGSLLIGVAAWSLASRVPSEWETTISAEQLDELSQEAGGFITNSNAVAKLTAIAAPLLKVVPLNNKKVIFEILDDPSPNACALPDGHVVVNTGLLEMTESEEELLAVLSHELSHVSKRHFARRLIASAGPLVVISVFVRNGNGLISLLAAGSGALMVTGFSQEYEMEADDAGWKYLLAAHIDPRGAISMFKKMEVYEAGEGSDSQIPQAFSTHPALSKRIERLESRWRKLSHPPEFLQLTNGLPKIEKSEKKEKTLKKDDDGLNSGIRL